jgi:hypothetical protein
VTVAMDKKALALRFLGELKTMAPEALQELIAREAGEELAEFFLAYTYSILAKDTEHLAQKASSVMLMGYLIRAYEERERLGPPAHA